MSVSTNKWLKFFTEAGLPSGVATNYAIIFTNHRIQNDMLCDLTKEILYDMGIKTMGDVIAILRHAKSVDHNTTRDQLLGQPDREAVAVKPRAGTRPTLSANSQTSQPLAHRFKTIAAKSATQDSSSTSNVISLKRTAETSGLMKSTNPKIRRIVTEEEDNDLIEDMNALKTNNGLVSVRSSSAKTSVFSRLGNERNSDQNSSIFSRLGNTSSGLDSANPKRRVTISGNSISTTVGNKNIIKLNTNSNSGSLVNRRTVSQPKKSPILPPNSGGGFRSAQSTDAISVRDRIGVNHMPTPNTISTTNRLIVNRSLASNRLNASNPAVAQAKMIAMRRAAAESGANRRTISLRKNIFDRLGPISL